MRWWGGGGGGGRGGAGGGGAPPLALGAALIMLSSTRPPPFPPSHTHTPSTSKSDNMVQNLETYQGEPQKAIPPSQILGGGTCLRGRGMEGKGGG